MDQVLQHYLTFVKPAYEEFCMPTKKFADVIIPRGADNMIAIELIREVANARILQILFFIRHTCSHSFWGMGRDKVVVEGRWFSLPKNDTGIEQMDRIRIQRLTYEGIYR